MVVAVADLVLPIPQAIEAGDDGSHRVRDARLGRNLGQVLAIRRRRDKASPPLLVETEQWGGEDEVARLPKATFPRVPRGGGQGFGRGWRQRTGGRFDLRLGDDGR